MNFEYNLTIFRQKSLKPIQVEATHVIDMYIVCSLYSNMTVLLVEEASIFCKGFEAARVLKDRLSSLFYH